MEELDPSKRKTYVDMTLESGVDPIELQFTLVNDCKFKETIAYRSKACVNSIVLGTLQEKNYQSALLKSDAGNKLCVWGIKEAVNLITAMAEDGKSFEWISFKCTPQFLLSDEMYPAIKDILEKSECKYPERLCLEFDSSILSEDITKVRQAVIDLDLLKVKTLMTGCGSPKCPMHLLSHVPVTAVVFDSLVSEQIKDVKTRGVVSALIAYIHSMGIKTILRDILDDDHLALFAGMEPYAYIPSQFYVGKGAHAVGIITQKDLMM